MDALTNVRGGSDLRVFQGLHSPVLTAAAVLLAGAGSAALTLAAWSVVAEVPWPKRADLAAIPWWAWAGGCPQGSTVLAVFLTAGRTGAALFPALTVTGGAVCSLLLDRYGPVGFERHPLDWGRVGGAMPLAAGTVPMAR